jgi:hypothetical protein
VDPKMIFAIGPLLIRAKGQTHPGSSKIGRSLRKENNSEGLRDKMRADMCISGGLLFMWGVVPNFSFVVSVVV